MVGEGDQGANIFGAQAGDMLNQASNEMPSSEMIKTSTMGDLGSSGGTGSTESGNDQVKASDVDPTDRAEVFSRNIGKTETPAGVNRISDRIRQNEKTLQERSDAYTQGYKDRYQYDVDQSQLDKAVKGDRQAYRDTSSFLAKQKADYRPEFTGAEDLYMGNALDKLDTQAGLQQLAAEGKGPRYSQGMSAFDAMLMQRDPAFQNMVRNIRGEQAALEGKLGTRADELEGQAQEYGQSQLESAQQKADEYLANYQDELIKQNEREAQEYNQGLKGLDREAISADALSSARGQAAEDLKQLFGNRDFETSLNPFMSAAEADPNKYVSFDQGDYGYRDFIDRGEAQQFNNLMSLLGQGGQAYSESRGPGDAYSIDSQSLRNALLEDAVSRRREQDVVQEAAKANIISEAQKRADADDARRMGLVQSYDQDLENIAQQVRQENELLAPYIDEGLISEYRRPEEQMDLGYADVLSEDEALRLNAIAKDLGLTDTYQAGGYQTGGPEGFIDEQDFRNYLLDKARAEDKQIKDNMEAKRIADAGGSPVMLDDGTIIDAAPPRQSIAGHSLNVASADSQQGVPLIPDVHPDTPMIQSGAVYSPDDLDNRFDTNPYNIDLFGSFV